MAGFINLIIGVYLMAINHLLETTNKTFWDIENAINQCESVSSQLLKAREDVSSIVHGLRKLSPEAFGKFDMMGSPEVEPKKLSSL